MPEDDTIGRIIQRDLDQLPLLPADRWVPRKPAARERTQFGRVPSAVPLARAMSLGLAITVVAAAAGLGLANWRTQRTAPDEPPTAAIGVPGPLALAGGAPSLGFGLVSTEVNTLLVRNETTVSAPFTISNALPQVAVSPNGHEIAYWRTVPDRTGGATWELFRSDLIDPAARDVGVMTTPAGEVPGSFVWSSDGTGLVVNTHTAVQRGPVAGGSSSAAHSTWFIVDVASRKATELAPAFASVVSTVYAWDRQRDLITGSAFTALGQNAFVTLQSGRVATHALPAGTMIAAADAYGRSVVLASAEDCKGISATRCPVLETRDQATFNAVSVWESLNEPTRDLPQVVFRPRSQDLIVQFALPSGDARVELWSDLGRGAHQVLATYTHTARFTGPRELVLPRVDGGAVFLMKFDNSAGGRWFGEIVSLSPLYATPGGKDPQRTPFEILTGGNPLASVVLDPAFASAMATPHQTSPSPSPVPSARPTGGIEAYALGALHGEYAFVLNGGATTTPGTVAEVWVIPLAGGEPRLAARYVNAKTPSTATGANVLARQFSPDGRRLLLSVAVARAAGGERLAMFIVDLETGRVQPVGSEEDADHEAPAWSPDGKHIAYVRRPIFGDGRTGGPDDGIWFMNVDATGARKLALTPGPASHTGTPRVELHSWTPDGRIAWFWPSLENVLTFTDIDTGVHTLVRSGVGDVRGLSFRIAAPRLAGSFSDRPGNCPGHFVAVLDGAAERILVRAPDRQQCPLRIHDVRWNPVRDEVLYVLEATTNELHTNELSGATTLIADGADAVLAEWSPRGTHLLYINRLTRQQDALPLRGHQLHYVRRDGSDDRTIFVPRGQAALSDVAARSYP